MGVTVPGGASVLIKSVRAANALCKAVKVGRGIDATINLYQAARSGIDAYEIASTEGVFDGNGNFNWRFGLAAFGAGLGGTHLGVRGVQLGRRSVAPSSDVLSGGIHRVGRAGFADLDHAGVPLRTLSSDRIKITNRGIDVVDNHLSRFTRPDGSPFGSNTAMLRDLRRIASGELKATKIHRDFYAHELREFVRFRAKGFESGMPHYGIYKNAHYATLKEYGIPFDDHGDYLYTPFALSMLFR